jgi:uncharacterized membrane protein YfcA
VPSLDLSQLLLLAGAALVAGAVNAVAGGGSLLSFPALLAVGYPALTANVTNSVALTPGYFGGTLGYRRELTGQRARILALGATSAVGAVVGAALLLVSSQALFERIVPWLIFLACGLLAVQPLAAAYGAYFGAGVGIMMLAILGIFVADTLQRLNALKGLLSLLVAIIAAVAFALFADVGWVAVAVMAVASLLGGQLGVVLARRLNDRALRWLVVAFGTAVGLRLLLGG